MYFTKFSNKIIMNKYLNKILVLSILIVFHINALGQDTNFSFANAKITNDGIDDFYEVDVMIQSSVGFELGSGLLYFDYNTAAFGTAVSANGNVFYERLAGSILAEVLEIAPGFALPLYNNFIQNDNTPSRVALSFQQALNNTVIADDIVTTTPKVLFHLRIRYDDVNQDPMVCFTSVDPFDDQTGTACGGSADFPFAVDCFNNPGMLLENDTFDCSGATLRCTGITTTWNGTNWDNGAPGQTNRAVIDGNYDTSVSGDINACVLIINTSFTLTITDGNFINIQHDITNNGALQVDHQASVVQVEEDAITTNNGSITVRKTTPSIIARNFIATSSPMSAETRDGVYGASRAVFNVIPQNFVPFDLSSFPEFAGAENFLDDNNDYFVAVTGSDALPTVGIGQWVFPSPDHDAPMASYDLDYTQGTLNSGTYSIAINYNGPATLNNYNLLGNPYASAIDVTAFITGNDAVNEVYYWDHITNPTAALPGAGTSDFSMNDISMRNAMMGVAAVNGGTVPGQFMASGQGFGIKADQAEMVSNTPVVFTNSIRVTGNNDDFRSSELDKLWLNLTTSSYEEAQSQAGIGFTSNATQGIDVGYDSKRLGTFLSLFTNVDGEYLAIQGREAFDENIEIALGFSSAVEEVTSYTISIDHFDGLNMEQFPIFLIDNLLETSINLKENDYTFTSGKTIQPDRFTVVFKESETLNTEEESFSESIVLYPNPASDHIILTYTGNTILNKAMIIDVQGKLVKEIDLSNFETNQGINIQALAKGMYFIQIVSNEKLITKKFIVR